MLLLVLLAFQSPPTVTLVGKALPLPEVLSAVRKQAGIDLLVSLPDSPPLITLALRAVPVWNALDAIASQVGGVVVPGGRDGQLRLLPLAKGTKAMPTCSDGTFRFRALRSSAVRELDGSRAATMVTVEVAWLPGTRPLYLDATASDVKLLDSNGVSIPVQADSSNLAAVEGRHSVSFDVSLPGFPRAMPRLNLVQGRLNAVVASEMLLFKFANNLEAMLPESLTGAVRSIKQKDVGCRVERLVLGRDRWTIRMALDYPPGNRDLESYQAGAMVAFNELRLIGPGGKRLSPSAFAADNTSARRVVVTYHFTEAGIAPKGTPKAWRIEYAAPARIIDLPLRFSFRDVPLP